MLGQVSRKQHPGLDALALNVLNQAVPVHALPAGNEKAEPAGIGVLCRHRKNQLIRRILQVFPQAFKIMAPLFHKGGKLIQLGTADGRLHVGGLQIISKMRIHVFMIIAQRQFSVLPVKPMAAEIIFSGWAYTVTAPIPK